MRDAIVSCRFTCTCRSGDAFCGSGEWAENGDALSASWLRKCGLNGEYRLTVQRPIKVLVTVPTFLYKSRVERSERIPTSVVHQFSIFFPLHLCLLPLPSALLCRLSLWKGKRRNKDGKKKYPQNERWKNDSWHQQIILLPIGILHHTVLQASIV